MNKQGLGKILKKQQKPLSILGKKILKLKFQM